MAGMDANTLVQVGDEPSVLADRRLISDGLSVTGQNYVGSLLRTTAMPGWIASAASCR